MKHNSSKISSIALGWSLAVLPAAAFAFFAAQLPALTQGDVLTWSLNWLPSLGVRFSFYLDGLSALFALLVTGIGAGILVYAGYYFSHEQGAGSNEPHTAQGSKLTAPSSWLPVESRFFLFLIFFMVAMLGLVLAGDIITLFVFWEGTSITSFLLVAYKYKLESARRGAFKALFVTGGGGIALMAGLIFAANIAGSSDLDKILASGDALRASALYPVMLGLIALGAFTKSAQFPAHFWLPNAMSAPTPASAFLHSATMVKAGIYLMARLYPALGGTELWFWLLSSAGLLTMLTGAIIGLRQNDLKGLLAYSTISQLGVLMLLIGQDTPEAFKALIVGILAHALYKATLFLIAGIVDHGTGTRDLRTFAKMSLHKAMPITLVIGSIAALSMAGLPPLLGFLAKETLLAATTAHDLPFLARVLFPVIAVMVGALMLVQAAILIVDTFFGASRRRTTDGGRQADVGASTGGHPSPDIHEAPLGMLLAPAILAVLSLVFALVPSFTSPTDSPFAQFIATAAANAYGEKVKVNLALFTGFNIPLALSGVAIAIGAVIFVVRNRWLNREAYAIEPKFNVRHVYTATLGGLDRLAHIATRLQGGSLRTYLAIMLVTIAALVAFFGRLPIGPAPRLSFDQLSLLRAFSLLLVVASSAASIVLKRDLLAVLALGASGLAMALLIALEPSPDVALVQIVVDILTTLLLLFALLKLPKDGGLPGGIKVKHASPHRRFSTRDALLALGSGIVMAAICFFALASRPRQSLVTPYYEQNSKPLTGSGDIVGAIVVDFRGFDTMIEISVFSMAGLAVFTLLQFAAKKHKDEGVRGEGDKEKTISSSPHPLTSSSILGITGPTLSPFIRALARILLPLALVIGLTHMIYGHDQPGDGFTAGVIISLAIGFTYLVYGPNQAKQRMPWVKPPVFIGAGILTVMVGSIAPVLLGASFFAPFDFGDALKLPLPDGFYISTSFLFEIAICLAVMGSTSFMVETLTKEEIRD